MAISNSYVSLPEGNDGRVMVSSLDMEHANNIDIWHNGRAPETQQ